MKKKKTALVLSGGGFNGAFQLGALNYINENWKKIMGLSTPMKFDIIAGVSVGALNGAMLAMNQLDLLNELWIKKIAKNGVREIYTSDFVDTSNTADKLKLKIDFPKVIRRLLPNFNVSLGLGSKIGLLFSKQKRKEVLRGLLKQLEESITNNLHNIKAIADNTPLRLKLHQLLEQEAITDTQFICGFVSLDTGKYHGVLHSDFSSNSDFINGVLASTAIPMVWEPVRNIEFKVNDQTVKSLNNVDGGIVNVSPLADVIKQINKDESDSEYKIIIINCNSGIPKQADYAKKSVAAIAARSLYEIAIKEVFNNDVNHFLKINELLKQAGQVNQDLMFYEGDTRLKQFEAVVINPDEEMDMGSALMANKRLVRLRMEHGLERAKKVFEKVIKGGALWN